jgi:large subunit ribosomal protein L6
MSRIGNNPIKIPEGVQVELLKDSISVKGKLGELKQSFSEVKIDINEGILNVQNLSKTKDSRAKHGLYRSLIYNMIQGVDKGFTKELELVGVGYRVKASGKTLDLTLGFSHPIKYELPESVSAETPSQTEIVLKSHDKQALGQVASEIRAFRPPEPYKGKGVKYSDERIKRKEAKKAAGGA